MMHDGATGSPTCPAPLIGPLPPGQEVQSYGVHYVPKSDCEAFALRMRTAHVIFFLHWHEKNVVVFFLYLAAAAKLLLCKTTFLLVLLKRENNKKVTLTFGLWVVHTLFNSAGCCVVSHGVMCEKSWIPGWRSRGGGGWGWGAVATWGTATKKKPFGPKKSIFLRKPIAAKLENKMGLCVTLKRGTHVLMWNSHKSLKLSRFYVNLVQYNPNLTNRPVNEMRLAWAPFWTVFSCVSNGTGTLHFDHLCHGSK